MAPSDGLEPHDQDGQRTLAMLLAAAVPPDQAGALTGWLAAASEGGFPGLGECLDDLERCGNAARQDELSAGNDGLGLDSLFDDDEEELLRRVVAPPHSALAADPGGHLAPGGGRPDCGARAHPQRGEDRLRRRRR